MRLALRFALSASVFLIILLLIVKIKLEDVWDQYDVSNYIAHSWKNTFQHGPVQNIPTFDGEASHKVVIMAKMEKENTDWVAENLPEYALLHLISSLTLLTNSTAGRRRFTPSTPPPTPRMLPSRPQ